MSRLRTLLILLLVLAAAGGGAYVYLQLRPHEDPRLIRISGNVEVTDAEVSFKIAGRVQARLVDDGEMVRAGQLVARLDSTALEHEVTLRRVELQAARTALARQDLAAETTHRVEP